MPVASLFAAPDADSLQKAEQLRDTAAVSSIKPGSEKEQKVFSDSRLKYRKQVETVSEDDFWSWLRNRFFKTFGGRNIDNAGTIIKWTIVLVSIVIIVALLWRSEISSLIRRKPKGTAFSFTDVTENLDSVDFETRIREALTRSDYRTATRWLYLKILFELDKKQIIVFAPYKTNIDYRYEIKNRLLQDDFSAISRIYEYVWYGQFTVNDVSYRNNENSFRQFEKRLNV